jgi:hypothetical protein
VLVTELSRWGRSTTDLLATLKELEARRVSVVALNGMTFDLATPHGRMMATVLAGIAEFERELIQKRIRSGIAAAKACGKRLGRQPGQRPKSDRLAPKVLALVAQGRSYRLVGREVGLSKRSATPRPRLSRPDEGQQETSGCPQTQQHNGACQDDGYSHGQGASRSASARMALPILGDGAVGRKRQRAGLVVLRSRQNRS